ncbi:MAG TPA: ATP-binding protein [Steroidobacteraceae bacterium]|jgi:signal transduction histidine kinase/ActR/RegA family two-component response regulator/HAMP domain-containing protein|nr:ATP-binding protein [Steroidobacteraceae bacterium]
MASMLLISAAAIVLTCSALILYELITTRDETLEQVATLARVVSANSTAALAFRDEQDAQEVLGTLRTEPSIVSAALYDENGKMLAAYAATGTSGELYPRQLGPDGFRLSAGRLEGFERVSERPDQRLGTLYIRADTSQLYARFWLWGAIAAAAMVASLLLAYFLSRIFQARISQPVLALAETASAVTERGDFSVRAPSIGEGEFEILTAAFNRMLAQIESQNDALRETLQERETAQRKLQSQVARLDLLQRATRAIGERQDLDSIFHVVVRSLEDNLPIEFACICTFEATQRRLTVASVGPKGAKRSAKLQLSSRTVLPIEHNGLSRCVNGVLVYEPDTRKVEFPVPQRFAEAGLHALVAAPLLVESHVFGVLLAARDEADSFSSGDCEFLRQLSEHVALAAHQVELYTKLQQAYEDLRESQDTILQQERLRALGQMASGIAHDINNAISPVTLYTDALLEQETQMSAHSRDYLRIIRRAIDDVGQTVARMREFYRQRERPSDLAPLELNPLVNQVLALTSARWRDLPQERGIVIDVRTVLASGLPRILGTESDIRDALTNLIFNAVDAMPEGGTLTLRTRQAPQSVDLEVRDTGSGMDEETRRRCFEPFFTTKGERGTGMGLAMVYGMAQRHDAQLEIDSALGVGTTVRVQFRPAPSAATVPAKPIATRPTRSLQLLVVDDDPLVSQSLLHVLSHEGHAVTTADGGQAGIDAFSAALTEGRTFDVVMTDLGMPYVDGRSVAAAVKALSPPTPVLLLTGWGQRLSTEQTVPEHVDRLLSKPPKLVELLAALAELTADTDRKE